MPTERASSQPDETHEREETLSQTPPPQGETTADQAEQIADSLTNAPEAGEGQREVLQRTVALLRGELQKKEEEPLTEADIEGIEVRIEGYRRSLANASVKDIRYKSRLLTPITEEEGEKGVRNRIKNLKSETAKRLLAYTHEFEEGHREGYFGDESDSWKNKWFTLNYQRVGRQAHEMNIGLGDILLDPDIKEILIQRSNGETIRAQRGPAQNPPRHRGRPSFIDSNGNYIATFTGEKFKILSGKRIDLTASNNDQEINEYIQIYKQEETARSSHRNTFRAQKERQRETFSITPNLQIPDLESRMQQEGRKITTPQSAIARLNQHREQNDGEKIINYARYVCNELGVPFSVFLEIISLESMGRWNPEVKNKETSATGLGQFTNSTWEGFRRISRDVSHSHRTFGGETLWTPNEVTFNPTTRNDARKNPYIMVYATAWLMRTRTKDRFNLTGENILQDGIIYFLAHHQGGGGARSFLRGLREGTTVQPVGNPSYDKLVEMITNIGIRALLNPETTDAQRRLAISQNERPSST